MGRSFCGFVADDSVIKVVQSNATKKEKGEARKLLSASLRGCRSCVEKLTNVDQKKKSR